MLVTDILMLGPRDAIQDGTRSIYARNLSMTITNRAAACLVQSLVTLVSGDQCGCVVSVAHHLRNIT